MRGTSWEITWGHKDIPFCLFIFLFNQCTFQLALSSQCPLMAWGRVQCSSGKQSDNYSCPHFCRPPWSWPFLPLFVFFMTFLWYLADLWPRGAVMWGFSRSATVSPIPSPSTIGLLYESLTPPTTSPHPPPWVASSGAVCILEGDLVDLWNDESSSKEHNVLTHCLFPGVGIDRVVSRSLGLPPLFKRLPPPH